MANPTVRLAFGGPPDAVAKGLAQPQARPALLVSYVYYKQFSTVRPRLAFRDWVLDSGAFSAHNSGTVIDVNRYAAFAKQRLATDPQLSEVYALDVIGDWHGSLQNCERLWAAGVPAIPCYHVGEPIDLLVALAKDYPKVALGGAVGLMPKAKVEWARQCFARIWPARVHGFGFGTERYLDALPFHSVDATNWEVGATRFGQWNAYGGQHMSVRGGQQNLRIEVDHYLAMEKRAQWRWRKQMAELAALPTAHASEVTQ